MRWIWLAVILTMGFVLEPIAVEAEQGTLSALSFENADIQTVIKHVCRLSGITFLFDPEQVKGKITLLSPKSVLPAEALELLKSALALHGYSVLSRAEGMWIVPALRVASEAMTVKGSPAHLCSGRRAGIHPLLGRPTQGSDRPLLSNQQPHHLGASGGG